MQSTSGVLVELLGVTVALYAVLSLVGFEFKTSPENYKLSYLLGASSGLLTGMTGVAMMPGVPYINSLGYGREKLIQALGIYFVLATTILAIVLNGFSLIGTQTAAISAMSCLPAILGLLIGAYLRLKVGEHGFQRTFLVGLCILGTTLTVTN